MIDTHAVIAGVDRLTELAREGQGEVLRWLGEQLQTLPVQQSTEADGSYAVTLPGKSPKTVALGGYVNGNTGQGPAALVISMETMKALARRYGSELACTLQLKLWAETAATGDTASTEDKLAAYLELQVGHAHAGTTGSGLSMVNASPEAGNAAFHTRLIALGDEAIRELTGEPATSAAAMPSQAQTMAQQGVPTAVMSLQMPGNSAESARLPLLQAAESFGRWAESTMHLVGGDEVDLWAREHRLPHVEQH